MLPRHKVKAFSTDGGGDDGTFRCNGFENFQPRTAANSQGNDHDSAPAKEWSDIGHISMKFYAAANMQAIDEPRRRLAPHQNQAGRRFLSQDFWKYPIQEQFHSI